jgi:hypothetical protein
MKLAAPRGDAVEIVESAPIPQQLEDLQVRRRRGRTDQAPAAAAASDRAVESSPSPDPQNEPVPPGPSRRRGPSPQRSQRGASASPTCGRPSRNDGQASARSTSTHSVPSTPQCCHRDTTGAAATGAAKGTRSAIQAPRGALLGSVKRHVQSGSHCVWLAPSNWYRTANLLPANRRITDSPQNQPRGGTHPRYSPPQPSIIYNQKPIIFQAFPPMEPAGLEPATSCLQSRRSPS